ncbi:MAG: hypothetical protein ACRDZQ_10290 [Acidimicrobiales bacterium]
MPTEITDAGVEHFDAPFELGTLLLDDPGHGEAQMRLVATGVCHTDGLARHGDLPFPLPGVLGPRGRGWWRASATAWTTSAPATTW